MALGDSGEDFVGYEPTTTDPGWYATFLVVMICLGMNLSLPILVRIVKACKRRKETDMITDDEKSVQYPSNPIVMFEQKKNGDSHKTPQRRLQGAGGRRKAASDVSDGCHSVKSTSSSASFLSAVISSVLEARPSKGHKHHYRKKPREGINSPVYNNQDLTGLNNAQIQEVLNKESDDLSICNKSIMSTLDHDAVSINDAADAKEGTIPQQQGLGTMEEEMGFLDSVFEISEWDFEARRLVALFIPYFVQALTAGALEIVQLAIIGHFLGGTATNAFIMVTLLVEFTGTLTHGFVEGKSFSQKHAIAQL